METPIKKKTDSQQIRLSISREHYDWLVMMEHHGVDRSALINLALTVFIPRTENMNLEPKKIIEVAIQTQPINY